MTALTAVLLDTNVISPALGDSSALKERIERHPRVAIPFIAVAELRYGAFYSSKPKEQYEKIERFIHAFPIVLANDFTMNLFGKVKSELRVKGKLIPDHDIWIAALGLQYGLTVITRDAHFARVKDLRVESW